MLFLNESQRLARLEAAVEALAKELAANIDEQSRSLPAAALNQQKEILAAMYRETSSYANIIILAAYAGIFGIWQLTNSYLSAVVRGAVASLLILSIVLFAAYETYKMISNAIWLERLGRALDKLPIEVRMEAWNKGLTRRHLVENRMWVYFLVPTVASGVAAAVLLLGTFLLRTLGW
jgi:hypothetical protein